MTLFITTPSRRYEIADAYVMALTFIIVYWVTTITKQAIEKQMSSKKKKNKTIKLPDPRGGGKEIKVSDDTELGFIILSCIADNESYIVKSQKIREVIFRLGKRKIEKDSLVITPNMIRFLALKLINEDQSLIVKIGNIVFSASNRIRLMTRIVGTSVIAFMGAIFMNLPFAILMVMVYFDQTQYCGYNCDAHFQHVSEKEAINIYAEEPAGHLAISGNDEARQVAIYNPTKAADKIIDVTAERRTVEKEYQRSRKKAKEVKFSEFRKTDPVLSQFQDLPEPEVPQKVCKLNDVHEVFDIKVEKVEQK